MHPGCTNSFRNFSGLHPDQRRDQIYDDFNPHPLNLLVDHMYKNQP